MHYVSDFMDILCPIEDLDVAREKAQISNLVNTNNEDLMKDEPE